MNANVAALCDPLQFKRCRVKGIKMRFVAAFAIQLCTLLLYAGERPREGGLKVGDAAPDFTLKSPDDKKKVTLSEFSGKKPVVLVFGSYT
jgi:hypothetical protein